MRLVAGEMKRQGFELPLMIGGATTSRVHTALRIEPEYGHGVFWVKDASRAVGVAGKLLKAESRRELHDATTKDYEKLRLRRAAGSRRQPPVSIEEARDNAFRPGAYDPVQPARPGLTVMADVPLADLVEYIDWTPFFQSWELNAQFPGILDDPEKGEAARPLYRDATDMLDQLVRERWLRANAVVGLFPAAREGDDVLVYRDGKREEVTERLCFLRQQKARPGDRPHLCLADFIQPAGPGNTDHIGMFAVTAGIGIEEHVARFEAANDDYSSIMLKALADRLAEALAEYTHALLRSKIWAYAHDESLDHDELIREAYVGIRPAPGYPACPEHSEKQKLFRLLDAEANCGMQLTESYAMLPTAAVSGYYFAHPESRYFVLGDIESDQVADYASRKGLSEDKVRKLLPANT
jgi:5-methyltetrahydrofolate--homocysteine methyltransferase